MQIVQHHSNIHPIFDKIESFYLITSEKPHTMLVKPLFPESFKSLYKLFKDYGNAEYDIKFEDRWYNKLELPNYRRRDIIVCFSGGKDSVATALYYKTLKYHVYLYHLKGINKTYRDEYKTAEQLAELLDLPLIEEECQLIGNHCWTEHPMKNMIIANCALQWGIKNNITTKIAFGNYYTSHIYNDPFEICAGDDIEMWQAYEKIIRQIIPRFKIRTPLENIQSSFEAIEKQPWLLDKIQSCIGPYRYREHLHRVNEKKYNIKLLPHRCGSCWKCAVEYIWFADCGLLEYNEEYYAHCLKVLQKTIKQETEERISDLSLVWQRYLFYDISKSKLYGGPNEQRGINQAAY